MIVLGGGGDRTTDARRCLGDYQRSRRVAVQGAVIATGLAASVAGSLGEEARQLKAYGEWTIYAGATAPDLSCFAIAKPKATEPGNLQRSAPFFYITSWPKDGVKTEISIKLGFDVKPGSPVTVGIGSASFRLFTDAERAWVADSIEELKLIEAMKKGSQMAVRAVNGRGVVATDTYSLNGISQALQALAGAC